MTTLAIIGTAGRGTDASRLTLPVWNNMKRTVYRFVKEHGFKSAISGGAAFADHLAVGLYNAGFLDSLVLALPCEFDWHKGEFKDSGVRDWRTNPGGTSNYYHRQFSAVIGANSLEQIKSAIYRGAEVKLEAGFMARNSLVAAADTVIAFTYGEGARIGSSGTADTVRKFLARRKPGLTLPAYHCDLNSMTLYEL